jgi:hypothetical protein
MSNPRRAGTFWTDVWQVFMPHKIRVFMWHACNSTLPTKTKLFQRGIVPSFACPICNKHLETEKHILWDCSYARAVWQASIISSLSVLDTEIFTSNDFLA